MTTTDQIISRIDNIISQNKRAERHCIILTTALSAAGIACLITALMSGELAWSIPTIITTALLYFSVHEIRNIRQRNTALATAPRLVNQLPTDQAAAGIQKLLERLYGEDQA